MVERLLRRDHGLDEFIKVRAIWNTATTSSRDSVCSMVFKAAKRKMDGGIEGDILSACEINEAHTLWMKKMQRSLSEKREFKHWKLQSGLNRDEKYLWRCKGRLGKASIALMTKHPIMLDKNHHLTTLIILECHSKVMHNGVKETLTEFSINCCNLLSLTVTNEYVYEHMFCLERFTRFLK